MRNLNNLNIKDVFSKKYFVIYLIYFFFYLANGPLEGLIAMAGAQIGGTAEKFGIFLSIIAIVDVFLPILIGGWYSKKGFFIVSVFAISIGAISSVFMGLFQNVFLFYFFAVLLVSSRTGLNFSLGTDINYNIPASNRGKFFGIRDLFLYGGISLGLLVSGIIIKTYDVSISYLGFPIFLLVSLYFIFKYKQSVQTQHKINGANNNEKITIGFGQYKSIIKNKRFVAFSVIQILTSIYYSAMAFLTLLGLKVGISFSNMAFLLGAVSLVNAILAVVLGSISDKYNKKYFYVFDLFFDMIPCILFALTKSPSLFIVGLLLSTIKDVFSPVSFAYKYDCFTKEEGTFAMPLLSSLASITTIATPVAIGFIWTYSTSLVFTIAAISSVLAGTIALLFLPKITNESPKEHITDTDNLQ